MALRLVTLFLFFASTATANIIFVNPNSSLGANDGTSWENAYLDLHEGLASTTLGDSIWVAEGTYVTTTSTNQEISFVLPEGISIFGGFAGTETDISQRDLDTNFTILSGEIGNLDTNTDNTFSVLSLEILQGSSNEINGLIVEKGFATPPSFLCLDCTEDKYCKSGGLFISVAENETLSNLTIQNCIFRENIGFAGSGLYITAESAVDIDLEDCVFLENNYYTESCNYDEGGGGAYIAQTKSEIFQQETNIYNCLFDRNNGNSGQGGGLCYKQIGEGETNPHFNISHTDFINNFGGGFPASAGAGLAISGSTEALGDIKVENCNFLDNSSGAGFDSGGGGGIRSSCGGAGVLIENCTFENNIGDIGGGMFTIGDVTIIDCIFSNNYSNSGGGISNYGNLKVFNSLFYNNYAPETGGAIYNLTFSANYANSTFYNNHSDNGGGALAFGGTNSTITNCIFWENNSTNTDFNIIEGGSDTLTLSSCIFDTEDCGSVTTSVFNDVVNCEGNTFFNEYPEFRDTANLDFSLISCSIGVNAGSEIPDIFSAINTDIADNPRILDGITDIGAYEIKSIEAFVTVLDATGVENMDGLISIDSILGGVSPYEILWSNGVENSDNENLLQGNYQVTITDSIGCTYMTTYQVSFTSAIKNISQENYQIVPNPVQDISTFSWLDTSTDLWTIKVFGLEGKIIFSQSNLSQKSISLHIENYPVGVYIVTVERNGEVLREKLVKI